MAEIVNLNHARKQRDRAERDARADANRVRHGRTRAERAGDRREEERRRALLDGARLPAGGARDDDTPG